MSMDWGYVAGYFDGEGTVVCGKKIGIQFVNTHRASIVELKAFLGAGHIRRQTGDIHRLGRKPIFVLRISRNDDLRRILPRLIARSLVKRAKLEKLLTVVRERRGIAAAFEWWRHINLAALVRRYRQPDGSLEVIAREYGVSRTAIFKLLVRKGIRRKPWGGPKGRVVSVTERLKVSRAKKAFWAVPRNRRMMSQSMTGVRHRKRVA